MKKNNFFSFLKNNNDDLTLTQRTLQNIGISGGATVISKGLRTISAIALARLLNPIDFSIVGISQVLLGFINQFSDVGYYAAVIQRKDKIETAQYTGFYLRLFQALGVALLLFLLAPFWAKFYETQAITNVIRISLISIIVAPFSFIPTTHFLKNLQFKKSAIVGISQNAAYVIIAVALALFGFGYWSIVWGTVVGSAISVVVACLILPWKFKFNFNPQVAKELFNFGRFILLCGLIGFAISNIDNMLIGKVAGMTLLGYYVIAYKWGLWVKNNLASVIGSVMFPTFSKIQDDIERLKKGYLQSLKYFSMVAFPVSLGLLAIAPEFIKVVLSPKWIPATIPMQILCIAGLCQTLGILDRKIFEAKGQPKINTKLDALFLVILIAILYPLVKYWEIIGASIAVLIPSFIIKISQYLSITRLISLKKRSILTSLYKSLFCSIVMLIAIFGARKYLYDMHLKEGVVFVILFFIGVIIYFLMTVFISKKDLFELWKRLKEKKQ